MTEQQLKLAQDIIGLENSLDMMFLVIAGAMVLLMQLGFAFLEGGCVRYKSLQSIMLKVCANTCVCVVMWWLIGYGIAFGKVKTYFVGSSNFAGEDYDNSINWSAWVFQTAVAIAANSIVSGGAAERMTYYGYVGLSFAFSGFIYPFAAHWGFGSGWLMDMGYHDFAGCGTVHTVGGVGALVLTIMLKPRKQRFNPKFAEHFEPSNPTYITLATLSLWTCWCFFNGGSTLGVTDGRSVVYGRAVMNTFISGAAGTLTVFFLHYFINMNGTNRFSLVMLCNGNLAGLVAITGPCDNVEGWAAFIIGTMGGFVYIFVNKLLFKLEIDDPVDAVPIHLGCGLLGANAVSWFDMTHGIFYCGGGRQFGVQLLGSLCFAAWSAILTIAVVAIIDTCNMLRVNENIENQGIDFAISSGGAYKFAPLPTKMLKQIQL